MLQMTKTSVGAVGLKIERNRQLLLAVLWDCKREVLSRVSSYTQEQSGENLPPNGKTSKEVKNNTDNHKLSGSEGHADVPQIH